MANKMLFRVDCDGEDLWNLYMDSLPEEINPIYRERKVHDCSTCHSFFRHAANVVAVDEDTYELTTLFDCVPHKDYEGVFEAFVNPGVSSGWLPCSFRLYQSLV